VLKDHRQLQKVLEYQSMLRWHAPTDSLFQDREKKTSKLEQSGLTEEELLAQQQALFAQSRAKFESTGQPQ
jgi:hypothetical protein